MNKIVSFITSLLLLYSCQSVEKNNLAYRITEKDLIPEGITHSTSTGSFYLSSILKSKIIQINAATGEAKDFVTSEILQMRFLGMFVDDQRGHLWACGNISKDGKFYSTVAQFDVQTGTLLHSNLHSDSVENIFNDLVQDSKGAIYFTNTSKQTIYKIEPNSDAFSQFFDDEAILHPNGITISPDEKYLYIASTENGIRILDIATKTIINQPADSINSTGLDGIKYYQNSIIAVQNEVRERSERKIARYFLNPTGTEITGMHIIDQNHPLFDIPTTLVIVDNAVYCLANSQMGNVDWRTYQIRSREALDDIFILKFQL